MVYISCNPETLARDLEILTRGGYKAMRAQPVDMFPHTNHVECVVQLDYVGSPSPRSGTGRGQADNRPYRKNTGNGKKLRKNT